MINDIKETVETYHSRFGMATTDEERQQLAVAYQTFIDQLTASQQVVAREVARPFLLNAVAMAEQMEPTLQRAKDMLNRRQEPA